MPAGRGNSQTIHIGSGSTIESLNVSELERPGELGQCVYLPSNKKYQLVKLDSGATASTPVGAVARGDLAFWRAKGTPPSGFTPYTVTNDIRVALGAEDSTKDQKRNNVAGVFMVAATAGYYTAIQTGGNMSAVASDGGGDFAAGDKCVAGDNTEAEIDVVAAGTAPTHTVVGTIAAAESAGFTSVALDLPDVP